MLNRVMLIGNLGRDPEVKQMPSGTAVGNLSIATTERVKRGEVWEDQTEWHRVVCFGRTAENVAKFKKKGDTLYIEGRIRTSKWKDKDGQDRYTTEIVADDVRFVGGGKGARDERPDHGGGDIPASGVQPNSYDSFGGAGDIPF